MYKPGRGVPKIDRISHLIGYLKQEKRRGGGGGRRKEGRGEKGGNRKKRRKKNNPRLYLNLEYALYRPFPCLNQLG